MVAPDGQSLSTLNMNIIRLCLISALSIGFLSITSQSLRFELESGHTKCIAEDIKSNSMTVGKYSIVNAEEGHPLPESHKVTVRVTSTSGNSYHYSEHVDSGQFAFTAAETGDYMVCFWAVDHNPKVTLTIDFDWKTGVLAKDWPNVAKKGSVDIFYMDSSLYTEKYSLLSTMMVDSVEAVGCSICPVSYLMPVMELELKKLYDTVNSIHQEMFYLREREEEMQDLNRSTNSRMAWLSGLSLFICLTVAGMQLWHLKTFFEKKKII
ncbi:hypothetical protein JRO89_XS05G0037700 [Xanthoceras sorbifolium]|uniref:GOLD domain-containing protein n=1 Tax=Xanthoceras sorbifolium TaxID=99658 RepID=A0ABQ8I0D9_9ROSI|nr:hypothetical protein JRO89_XS05G0037700 [Xanthoceras sorbifolium]